MPLAKSLAQTLAGGSRLRRPRRVRITRMCMQILGGIGYIREYPAEKLHRDALVLPVYEGTLDLAQAQARADELSDEVTE